MKTNILSPLVISCFCVLQTQAQNFNLQEIETHFSQNNLSLIAKKYQISESEALLIQEKLLPNPSLAISEVNFWKNGSSEQMPYLFGKYGQTQQISLELEQLIETAGKRKKRVAIKANEIKQATFEFEELLRELKKELRFIYWNLFRISETRQQTEALVQLYQQLNEQYTRQANLKNISQADAYRVQTAFLNLQSENAELLQEQAEHLLRLQQLTQIPNLKLEQIVFPIIPSDLSQKIPLNISETTQQNNISLMLQNNQIDLAKKQLDLEEAQRIPDLNLQVNYDRGGNIMRDFVGVGVRFDLPVFNRNKGNISAAKSNIEMQKVERNAIERQIENDSNFAISQLFQFEKLMKQRNNFSQENATDLLQNYYKHLQNKHITLIEFIDFTQAHLESQKAYNHWVNQYYANYEQLQYLAGKDF